jgi:NAD(P)-dependent dehydrogenase (short-subunit alcohol dehydrogenase family)
MRLCGHHALITGGGTGIGAAVARALAEEGAKLTLVGRRLGRLEITADQIRSVRAKSRTVIERSRDAIAPDSLGSARQGVSTSLDTNGGVMVHAADVTDRAEVDGAFAAARAAQGPITILVNNAGTSEAVPFARLTAESWRHQMAVNLDALLHCSQSALADLLDAEAGRIVTIASTAGLKGYGYTAAYTAAKHGAIGFTRSLAMEFAGTNLTVNAVCPGFTDTDMLDEAVSAIVSSTGRSEVEARRALEKFNPQGRLVTPEEVANAVVWLCLPESRSINGQAIAVAGGEVM